MHIVILGASTVGTSVAATLCARNQSVVLVDDSPERLAAAEEQLDVSIVQGSPCDAITLFQAGIPSADLCLAVSQNDEVNLIGASLARSMGTKRTVARMFNPSYLDNSTFDYQRHFGVDRLISLEQLTALELAKEIRLPGLLAIENFARGELEVQEVSVGQRCRAVGIPLKELDLPVGTRIGLISRQDGTFIPGANDVIQTDDHITLFGHQDRLGEASRLFESRSSISLQIVIAGGGEIGYQLARILSRARYKVTIMETDQARAEYLAEKLGNTVLVLNADATRKTDMQEARVGHSDVFVGSTGRDADNIVCALEARELGCKRVMSIVRRPDYTDILVKTGIDTAVSPREVMETMVQGYLATGPIINRSPLAGGEAEMIEVEITPNAAVAGVPLKDLGLTNGLVAAIIREDYVKVPGATDFLKPGDVAVLLTQTAHSGTMLQPFLHKS